MSHLDNHLEKYPVGMTLGKRTIIANGINVNGNWFVKVKCTCRTINTLRPSNVRDTCHGCKKKALNDTKDNFHAQEFGKRFLGNPKGKLVPVEVVKKVIGATSVYSVVFYCECNPRVKYITTYQRWKSRKHLHCVKCAPADVYIAPPVRYKKKTRVV